jgi:abequosyltransferase
VCIPTHQGRAAPLRHALESVIDQLEPGVADRVEVCISDNASVDGTKELVEDFRRRGLKVAYQRSETDLGASPNLLRAVQMAAGEYCWLLGSDDSLEPGGLRAMLEALDRHPGLTGVTAGKRNFDAGLQRELSPDPPHLLPADPRRAHLYSTAGRVADNVLPTLGFMSSQVVRRASWCGAVERIGQARAGQFPILFYLYVLGEMALAEPCWLWLPGPLVIRRTGTSDFAEFAPSLGDWRFGPHLSIVRESEAIWAALVGRRSRRHRQLMRGVCAAFAEPRTLAWHKLAPGHTFADDVRMLAGFARAARGVPRFWATSLPLLLVPHQAVKAARAVRDLLTGARPRQSSAP